MNTAKPAPVIAKYLSVSWPSASAEEDYYLRCPVCGQMIDCRDLAQVFHHAQRVHEPLPPE